MLLINKQQKPIIKFLVITLCHAEGRTIWLDWYYHRALQIIIFDYSAQMAIRSSFIFSKKAQEYLTYFEHFFEKIKLEMMVRWDAIIENNYLKSSISCFTCENYLYWMVLLPNKKTLLWSKLIEHYNTGIIGWLVFQELMFWRRSIACCLEFIQNNMASTLF